MCDPKMMETGMSEEYYRFVPLKADFETLRSEEADWATNDDFPGLERQRMLIVTHDLYGGDYVTFRYYETKERAIFAVQDEIKEHIKKLESFLLKASV